MLASLSAQEAPKPPAPPTATPAPTAPSANRVAPATPANTQPPGGNRVFGIIPNYRTADMSQIGTPLTPRQKFSIAARDSFDYPTVLLAAAVAGIGQWNNSNPSFGQGAKGYGHRWITSYADQAMGNMFTEAVYPVLLHEDPRYFRRGTGTVKSRAVYALSRVMVTHKDSGKTGFNFSEWLGNASAVAISNAYYPDNRTFVDNGTKLLMQVGTDAVSQVLKEFWPDIKRKMFHKKSDQDPGRTALDPTQCGQ
jgi:hypothetical protein